MYHLNIDNHTIRQNRKTVLMICAIDNEIRHLFKLFSFLGLVLVQHSVLRSRVFLNKENNFMTQMVKSGSVPDPTNYPSPASSTRDAALTTSY